MNTRHIKMLFVALTLPFLTGCAFIDNLVNGIALNAIFSSDFILNRVAFTSGEASFEQYDPKPTSTDKRGDLTYGLEALVIPKTIETSQFGFDVKIDFELTFAGTSESYFYREDYAAPEGESDINFTAEILYPVGSVTPPTSIEDIATYLNVERMLDFHSETARDVEITIKGTAGTKTKSQTFYLNLNNEGITLPGGEDVDIDLDYALVVTKDAEEKSLDVTIPKEDVSSGYAIPLQVMWVELGKSGVHGNLTITIEGLVTEDYDLTLPELTLPLDVIVNETLVEYPVTITLKTGKPVPTEDLTITFKAMVTIPS